MDILEGYDSDPNVDADAALVESQAPLSLMELYRKRSEAKSNSNEVQVNVLKASNGPLKVEDPVDLLTSDEAVAALAPNSKIKEAYMKSKLLGNSSENVVNVSKAGHSGSAGTELRLHDKDSSVLEIEIGTRYNSTGIVTVNEDDDTAASRPNKIQKGLDVKSKALLTSCLADRGFDIEATLATGAVVIGDNAAIDPVTGNSVVAVYKTPSGQSTKTFVDDQSFHDVMREADAEIIRLNSEHVDFTKRRRMKELESEDVHGPWIPFEEFERVHPKLPDVELPMPAIPKPKEAISGVKKSHEKSAFAKCNPEEALSLNTVETVDGSSQTSFDGNVGSTLHKRVDAQYKNWTLCSRNFKQFDPETYRAIIPKKEIHTYVGHSMAVTAIRYTPKVGHLLLSSSMDGFVKIWDSHNNRKCIRTYKGHCKGVKQVNFVADGFSRFYSCGCDGNVIQWDTEYGKVCGVYPIDQMPSCVTSHPTDANVFLVGGANNKACQFDARSGKIELEYNAHLSTVNTVTFIDNNRKIVTTGDDRRLLVWEYNIPVSVKQITEQCMNSLSAVVRHPSDKFILAQSMSNQILVYESMGSRVKFFGKKKFRGHTSYGYSITPACSPEGKYVVSGDTRGRIFFWDWKSCRLLETLDAHKSVVVDCQWHPNQPSRIATCSWDGSIKLWD